jgi:hypothetical protein
MGLFDIFTGKEKVETNTPSNCMPDITIEWGCCKVKVTSDKTLSHVTLDLESGAVKDNLEDLGLYTKTYCLEEKIKGVWVKAGCNFNEDEEHPCPDVDPSCGQYYENPNYPECSCKDECGTPPPPPPPAVTLGDKVVLTWGSDKCRGENGLLEMTGDAINGEGYAIPFKSKIVALTATWNDIGCGNYNEVLIIQVNGIDTDAKLEIVKDEELSKKCIVLDKPIELKACDSVNIVSRAINNKCWEQTCNLEVTVWLATTCDCNEGPEGSGIIEVIDTIGAASVGTSWGVRKLDTVRNNTIPTYASFDDAGDFISLKEGIYSIWYGCAIATVQSINLVYEIRLQVDEGLGWVDIPFSGNTDHDLSGDIGNLSTTRAITYNVPTGKTYNFRIIEKVSADTSIQSSQSGAGFIAERIANGQAV